MIEMIPSERIDTHSHTGPDYSTWTLKWSIKIKKVYGLPVLNELFARLYPVYTIQPVVKRV